MKIRRKGEKESVKGKVLKSYCAKRLKTYLMGSGLGKVLEDEKNKSFGD